MQLICVLVLARAEGGARASAPIAVTDGRMTVGSRTDPAVAVAWLPTANLRLTICPQVDRKHGGEQRERELHGDSISPVPSTGSSRQRSAQQ